MGIKRAIDAEKRANKTENLLAAVGGSDGGDTAGGYGGGGDAAASTRGSDSQASNIGEDNGSADASNGTGISSSSMWSSASTITFLIALSSFLCLCNLATWCYCLRSRGCGNNDRRKKLESENETKPCLVGSTESVNPLQLPKDSPGVVETRRMLTPSIHKNKGRMMVAAKRKSRRQSIKKEFGQVQMSSSLASKDGNQVDVPMMAAGTNPLYNGTNEETTTKTRNLNQQQGSRA